jgi:hypothetical protein
VLIPFVSVASTSTLVNLGLVQVCCEEYLYDKVYHGWILIIKISLFSCSNKISLISPRHVLILVVEGCGMPLSITGGHKGSYRKINPQLSQTVESLKLICRSLNTSSDQWWKSPSTVQSIHEMWEEKQRRGTFRQDDEDDSDDDYDNSVRRGKQEREELDSEEVVDLQANLGEDDGRLEDVDCADMASIDSDDSIWDQRN